MLKEKKNSSKYKYTEIEQSDVEEDGNIKVVFLRSIDDSERNFQVKENEVSCIKFDEVLDIIKNRSLKMKGNRIFYQCDTPIDVHEK